MNYLYMSLAFLVGFLLPVQVGINAELSRFVNSPLLAALVSFTVGGLCLLISVVVLRVPFPALGAVSTIPVWSWGGGLIGAAVVLGSILAGPKIGALALVGVLLAGQLIASVLMDHFGWLGFPIQKMTGVRFVGIMLLVGGLYLIRKN
ncbi:MAG: DMT family transporter [Nitrospina sp.]|jgi:bacterial/archaeal transporter family-2 protein|nr:DMT family transporter [Nitrospina sp.]MBT5632863.1 DMT family transporter [Nitrospina sp.]